MLKRSDIVVTNPPFYLFKEDIDQLIKYKKKYLTFCDKFIQHSKTVIDCRVKFRICFYSTLGLLLKVYNIKFINHIL